ncbi:DExH-box ATP-dependent RNA helicase DExH12-like protein [Tanacetum coccineum]
MKCFCLLVGYPNIDLTYDVLDSDNIRAGDNIALMVTIERDLEGRTEVGPVDAPRYPKTKEEGWWLVVDWGNPDHVLAGIEQDNQ